MFRELTRDAIYGFDPLMITSFAYQTLHAEIIARMYSSGPDSDGNFSHKPRVIIWNVYDKTHLDVKYWYSIFFFLRARNCALAIIIWTTFACYGCSSKREESDTTGQTWNKRRLTWKKSNLVCQSAPDRRRFRYVDFSDGIQLVVFNVDETTPSHTRWAHHSVTEQRNNDKIIITIKHSRDCSRNLSKPLLCNLHAIIK